MNSIDNDRCSLEDIIYDLKNMKNLSKKQIDNIKSFNDDDKNKIISAYKNCLEVAFEYIYNDKDDDKYEIDESIRITLSNANSTSQIGSATIHDYTINANDSKPALSFTASSGTADASSPEEGDGSETITVSLAAVSGVASSVTYTITGTATAGVDFTDATSDYDSDPSTNIITWAADDATVDKTIVINFTDDVIDEGSETIIITLSGVSGGATNGSDLVHTITLQDSDAPPVMQFTNSTMTVNGRFCLSFAKNVKSGFEYNSKTNPNFMNINEIKKIIKNFNCNSEI